MGLLNATKIKSLKDAGRYGDGDGLFLVITKNGGRSCVLRVQKNGNLQIDKIEAPDIRECIKPIWIEKHVTAKRVLQRILSVLNLADGEGFIDANISRAKILKGFRKPKDSEPKHHPAMPFKEVPDFINRIRERRSVGRLAFELLILTATRSGEVRNAVWSEIDLKEKLWTIPAERMKAGNEHIIPLSDEAISVLETAKFYREARSDIIFPGIRSGRAMSDMTLTKICRDMKIEAVPHGFRSSFRDWVAECTSFEPEVAEMALAHTIANKVEAAYRLHHINCHRLRKAVHASSDVT